ncbi:MAG: hypothetical protein MHM6MM_006210 [Cercozoa sp. M6MM]
MRAMTCPSEVSAVPSLGECTASRDCPPAHICKDIGGTLKCALPSGADPCSGNSDNCARPGDTCSIDTCERPNGALCQVSAQCENICEDCLCQDGFVLRFTSCGVTGRIGPIVGPGSDCDTTTTYPVLSATDPNQLATELALEQGGLDGSQQVTLPKTGLYRITATGACTYNDNHPGLGGFVSATFSFSAGEKLFVAVGQRNEPGRAGGGASIVMRGPVTPNAAATLFTAPVTQVLIVGGGAGSAISTSTVGCNALTNPATIGHGTERGVNLNNAACPEHSVALGNDGFLNTVAGPAAVGKGIISMMSSVSGLQGQSGGINGGFGGGGAGIGRPGAGGTATHTCVCVDVCVFVMVPNTRGLHGWR